MADQSNGGSQWVLGRLFVMSFMSFMSLVCKARNSEQSIRRRAEMDKYLELIQDLPQQSSGERQGRYDINDINDQTPWDHQAEADELLSQLRDHLAHLERDAAGKIPSVKVAVVRIWLEVAENKAKERSLEEVQRCLRLAGVR